MSQRVTGQRFRQRKLSTKQNLPVVREHEIEQALDDDAQRNIPKVETGVEKGEEIEHHLQAVISAQASALGGKVSQLYIPTPETLPSNIQYDELYPPRFQQPVSYIRFSSTVEDCIGCPYCMTAEDEAFLKSLNEKRSSTQCSEDQFEQVMYFFEETAQAKQPFAAVDNPPVLSYEEMESAFDETIDESCRGFARDIYEHWKAERLKHDNRSLMPGLKFERNVETDDNDPYVCFRRREVRQTRKTRGRDAQVTEKLQSLRRQLELARQLMHTVRQRENARMEQLQLDRTIFEQRSKLKEVKRNLNIKGDDEDLINQKPAPKPRPKLDGIAQRGMPGAGAKQSLARADSARTDSDLVLLDDVMAKKREEIERSIEERKASYANFNKGWVDATFRPITPPLESSNKSTFRTAVVEYLPTPPASVSSRDSGDNLQADEDTPMTDDSAVTVRFVSPPPEISMQSRPAYRRRIGRGGRLMIDRRGLKRPWTEDIDDRVVDRYAYDQDSDEDEEIYPYDPFDNEHIRYRIHLASSPTNRENAAAAAAAAQQAAQARKSLGGDATVAGGRPPPALARAGSSAQSAAPN